MVSLVVTGCVVWVVTGEVASVVGLQKEAITTMTDFNMNLILANP